MKNLSGGVRGWWEGLEGGSNLAWSEALKQRVNNLAADVYLH